MTAHKWIFAIKELNYFFLNASATICDLIFITNQLSLIVMKVTARNLPRLNLCYIQRKAY